MSKRGKKYRLTEEDRLLWSRVAKSVLPLRAKRGHAPIFGNAKIEKEPLNSDIKPITFTGEKHRGFGALADSEPGRSMRKSQMFVNQSEIHRDVSTLQPPRLEPGVLRRVRKGRLQIEATLDLHGLRQHEARDALGSFIEKSHGQGYRTVLVITGKGGRKTRNDETSQPSGVLQQQVPFWLREARLTSMVSGFDQATQRHGGSGAIYIRLRTARSRK